MSETTQRDAYAAKRQARKEYAESYGFTEPDEVQEGGMFGLGTRTMFGGKPLSLMDCIECGATVRYTHPHVSAEDHVDSPMVKHCASHIGRHARGSFLRDEREEFEAAIDAKRTQEESGG